MKKWRKKKKKAGDTDDEEEFEDVRIDEIEAGDEIMTFDENTGEFKVSTVKQLAFMGTRPVIEIETEGGNKIRTTSEHP